MRNKTLISLITAIPLTLSIGCFGPIGKETSGNETVGISSVSLDTFTMLDTSSSSSTSKDSPTSLDSTSNSEEITTSGKPNDYTSDSAETTNESSEPISECGNGVIESEEKCDEELTWTGDPQSFLQYEWSNGQINNCDTFTLGKLYCVQVSD